MLNITNKNSSGYYSSWFHNVTKGISYNEKSVCFRELYFPPLPGVPWFWNDWGIVNQCSQLAASPLYQSFNLFLRKRWVDMFGDFSLPPPLDRETVHVVIEVTLRLYS